MRNAKDLLGQWRGKAMGDPRNRIYDVLVFKEDGSGVFELSDVTLGFRERFRWSIEEGSGHLRLEGCERFELDPDRWTFEEVETTLNVDVGYGIREEDTELGRMRVLRFVPRPWPAMSDHYLFYRKDVLVHATFQAPCFEIEQEAADAPFRGLALTDYLAEQLEARRIGVGPRRKVYKGFCYRREIKIRGRKLGLSVNRDEESGGWWLRIDRPALGGTVEAEELHRLLDDVLRRVDGLHGLEWQTEEEWWES